MAIKSLSHSSIRDNVFYRSMLVGNEKVSFSAYHLLDSVTLSSTTGTIDFDNLDSYSDFKHLEFRLSMRSTSSDGDMNIGFNDTYASGSNLNWLQYNMEEGQNYAASPWDGLESIRTYYNANYSGDPATNFGPSRLMLTDVHSTTKSKSFHYEHATRMNGILYRRDYDGLFLSTSALTKVTFYKLSNQFAVGSKIDLYGYKAA